VRFEEMNWMDVEQYLKQDDRLIIITGACEQHGYLSLLTDIRIPQALADAASRATGVLVAPPLNFGCSPYFLSYPGTISLRISTMLEIVEDVLRSVHAQGFRRVLWLNGHGGNSAIRARINELLNELPGMQAAWYEWWVSHSVEQIAMKYELKPAHANWLEAFPFVRVADVPEGHKPPPHIVGLLNAEKTREAYGDGSFGGQYQVDAAIMDELFAACLEDVLRLLDFE